MPTYAYRCKTCQYDFSVEAKMSDPPPAQGPQCSGSDCQIQKLMVPVMGWVKGSSPMPPPAPRAAATSAALKPADDPVHLCSKYCDHHKV